MRSPSCLLAILLLAPLLPAQTRIGSIEPYPYSTGPIDHPGGAPAIVAEHLVRRPGAPFLTLELRDVVLPPGSRIDVESLRDGHRQSIDAASYASHGAHTACFNGDALRVRLVAGPGTRGNRFGIAAVGFGDAPAQRPLTLCGADDRTLSYDPSVCRLVIRDATTMYVGSAWLIDYMGAILTAGHNLSINGLKSLQAQFNVPKSAADGSIVNPPPIDQYDWSALGALYQHDANGDWGALRVQQNTTSGLYAGEAQIVVLRLGPPPALQANSKIAGFGIDDTPDKTFNHVQQVAFGPLTAISGDKLLHRVDTQGGNSGSPIVDFATGIAYGVHTAGGCDATATSANVGWSVEHPSFKAAQNSISPDKANLIPRSYSASSSAIQGKSAGVTVRVANLGRNSAAGYEIGVYLSTDDVITTSDRLLTSAAQPLQLAGNSRTAGIGAPIPTDVAPGNYWIGIIADRLNTVDEQIETDNTASRPIRIDLGKADLAAGISDVNFPYSVPPGVEVEVDVATGNQGEIGAPPTRTAVVLQYDAQTRYVLGWVDVPALAPNTSTPKVRLKVRIPWCAIGVGQVPFQAWADIDDVVVEKFEGNNASNFVPHVVTEYSSPGRELGFAPISTSIRETIAPASTKTGQTLKMCVLSQDLADTQYVLAWSAQPAFVYDEFTAFSLANINTPVFWYWWSNTDRRWGARPEIRVPALPSPLAFTVFTHALYFDQNMQLRGTASAPIRLDLLAQ
jgi:V8-like Glu-specific endopeptidase